MRINRPGLALVCAFMPAVTLAQTSDTARERPPRIVLEPLNAVPAAGDDRSADGGKDDAGDPAISGSTVTPSDPLGDVRRRWRDAVAAGSTDLGFRAWVLSVLGPESGPVGPEADRPRNLKNGPQTDDAGPAAKDNSRAERPQAERTRDVSQRWRERAGPVALGDAGRVVTTYGASVPTAFCAPLIVCYIELEPGEVLTDTPSWGDTARWQVTVKVQGADPETMVLEIKPSEDAGLTNLVIPTDRRLYTIHLVNDPGVSTPILSFRYPKRPRRRRSPHARRKRPKTTGRGRSKRRLRGRPSANGWSGRAFRPPPDRAMRESWISASASPARRRSGRCGSIPTAGTPISTCIRPTTGRCRRWCRAGARKTRCSTRALPPAAHGSSPTG